MNDDPWPPEHPAYGPWRPGMPMYVPVAVEPPSSLARHIVTWVGVLGVTAIWLVFIFELLALLDVGQ
jgi:hypothetical protein